MRWRSLLGCLAVYSLRLPCLAEPAATTPIAVLNFDAREVSEATAAIVSDLLRVELTKMGRFTVVERSKMEDLLREQGFQKSGCTSVECAVEVGRLLNVRKMVLGSVNRIGSSYVLSGRLVDVETGASKEGSNVSCAREEEFVQAAASLAKNLAMIEWLNEVKGLDRGRVVIKTIPSGAFATLKSRETPYETSEATPLEISNIPVGRYLLSLSKPDFHSLEREIEVKKGSNDPWEFTLDPIRAEMRSLKGSALGAVWRSALLPGWGQWYKGEPKKGNLLALAFGGAAVLAGTSYFIAESHYADYKTAQSSQAALQKFDEATLWDKITVIGAGVAGAVWIFSLVDSLFLEGDWENAASFPQRHIREPGLSAECNAQGLHIIQRWVF